MSKGDQKRILRLISLEEGLRLINEALHPAPLGMETVSLYDALGRVLGEDMYATMDIPDCDRASMDGYAVVSNDTKGASPEKGIRLAVVGRLFPSNSATNVSITSGQAVYTACGAPLPLGADAVIRVEEVRQVDGATIEVGRAIEAGESVYRVAEDVKKGELLIQKGRVLRSDDVGLLAALRRREVKVFRKPKVAIVSVSDELVELESEETNKMVNNYAFIIASLVSQFRAVPMMQSIVPDDPTLIKGSIDKALNEADLVVTISGCSVGLRDFVPDAINALGRVLFHGITVVPGRVTGVGLAKDKPIVMLPGLLLSMLAGFYLFVAPLLNCYSGGGMVMNLPMAKVELAVDVKARDVIGSFVLIRVERSSDGFRAEPLVKGKDVLKSLTKANGFIILPAGGIVRRGEKTDAYIFDFSGMTG